LVSPAISQLYQSAIRAHNHYTGEAFQKAALKLSGKLEAEVAARLGAKGMKTLRDLLERLSENIDEIEEL
jgi:hypothetical protein